ncbi:hypothetical protein EJB05_44563, partial [Eragrostis curvula]
VCFTAVVDRPRIYPGFSGGSASSPPTPSSSATLPAQLPAAGELLHRRCPHLLPFLCPSRAPEYLLSHGSELVPIVKLGALLRPVRPPPTRRQAQRQRLAARGARNLQSRQGFPFGRIAGKVMRICPIASSSLRKARLDEAAEENRAKQSYGIVLSQVLTKNCTHRCIIPSAVNDTDMMVLSFYGLGLHLIKLLIVSHFFSCYYKHHRPRIFKAHVKSIQRECSSLLKAQHLSWKK